MELLSSLVGLAVGAAIAYFAQARSAARERREQLFADALSAIVVDEANINFTATFNVSGLTRDEQAELDQEARIEAYRRRLRGVVEYREALARAWPYARELEAYLNPVDLTSAQRRELVTVLLKRLKHERRRL
jgi:hypothetical protein